MRTINKLIIHCTATKASQPVTVEDITRWHRQRGFRTIGYHFLIDINGHIHLGRPLAEAGAHCRGHNAHSIGVAYAGGIGANGKPENTLTLAQAAALNQIIQSMKLKFPGITIHGHNEFANKACPCFDVQEYLKKVYFK